jgi:hypothetical protein
MDDIWRAIGSFLAVLGAGGWVARVHVKTNRNEVDIDNVLHKLDNHTREAQAHSDRVHALSERIAVLETKADVNTKILGEIRDAVKRD